MSDREEESREAERPDADDASEGEREALDSNEEAAGELDEAEESKMRDLLKGALDPKKVEPAPDSEFLKGVQKRLRDRSGGKFYADGWSTAKHPPTYTYLWTSVLMLAIVIVVYATLTSLVGEAAEVENQPAPVPVQIVFPKSR